MRDDENKTVRFQMLMSPSEAKAIDDWGWEHRIRTRAEAIRRLSERGAKYDELEDIAAKAMRLLSRPHVLAALTEPERHRYEVLFRRWREFTAPDPAKRPPPIEDDDG